MKISPRSIYKHLKDGDLEKQSAINQLIVLINNSEDINIRIESIKILEEIGSKDEQIFNFYENLLISDSNELVRIAAINGIKNNFIEKAFKPMKWA
ncbi:MAG: HEAT repeat domain-containing protein, partial [Candidatus Lokiarchaeota archaeon]|nr:HEAT repeat domain-containing protein [Candidatus Lokiarchaeota archaeon]